MIYNESIVNLIFRWSFGSILITILNEQKLNYKQISAIFYQLKPKIENSLIFLIKVGYLVIKLIIII